MSTPPPLPKDPQSSAATHRAPPPLPAQKPAAWKRVLFWVFVAPVMGLVSLTILASVCSKIGSNATQPDKTERPAASVQAEEKVSAPSIDDLYRAFDENEVAADQALSGSKVRLTGTVTDIGMNAFGTANLQLRGQRYSVGVNLEDSEKDAAARLRKGHVVTVMCSSAHKILGSPQLRGCLLQ